MAKKILFVASVNPFGRGGGSQATHAYLDGALEVYGRKNVVLMIVDEVSIPVNYKDIDIIKVHIRSLSSRCVGYLRGYMSRFTEPLMKYLSDNKENFSICIINGSLTGGKAIPYINSLGIKTVVIYHNYELEYHRDNHSLESLKGHYFGMIKKLEGLSYREGNLNIFLTQQDQLLFRNAYGMEKGKSYVVGAFDFKDKEVENLSAITKDFDISVSGSLANYQTTVGVMDFHDRYLSIAKRIIPNLKVLLTGRNPSQHIKELQKSGNVVFSIIANPDDILSVVQKGRIYLCPTCIGGGLKLRVMDGLKCGLPVLVHKISARGYDAFFNKPYFQIYYDESTFEAGLRLILTYLEGNPNSIEQINHDYYDYFGYQRGIERFRDALNNI